MKIKQKQFKEQAKTKLKLRTQINTMAVCS